MQSNLEIIPTLTIVKSFSDLEFNRTNQHLVFDFSENREIPKTENNTIEIYIGPEGGFSTNEKNILRKYNPYSLSKTILRSETASIVACSIVKFINKI
jgi:RsmE family RNA methyltransferase